MPIAVIKATNVTKLIEDQESASTINEAIANMIGGEHNFQDVTEWDAIETAVAEFLQTNKDDLSEYNVDIESINTYIQQRIVSGPPPPPSELPTLKEVELQQILSAAPTQLSGEETTKTLKPDYDNADSFDMADVKVFYENPDYLRGVTNLTALTSSLVPYKDMYTNEILHRVLLVLAIINNHVGLVHKDNLARLVGVMIAPIDTIDGALTEAGKAEVKDDYSLSMSLAHDICNRFELPLLKMGAQRRPVQVGGDSDF